MILTHSRGFMMLSHAECELIMADSLGAHSPSIALLDDQ